MNSKKVPENLPLLVLILVNFTWGLDFIAIEYMVKFLPASMIAFTRLLIGSICMISFSLIKNRGIRIAKKDMPRIFFCGAVGLSLYYTVEPIGIGMTSGSMGALIMATVPIFGMTADRILYKKPITKMKVAAILTSILGVFILLTGGGTEDMKGNLIGIIIMFLAALMWTSFIAAVKPLHESYSVATILTGMFISGLIVSTPIMLLHVGEPMKWTSTTLLLTVLSAVIGVIGGEFGYIFAVGKLSVTLVSLFENVLPIVTVVFSIILFGQSLTPLQLLGGLIILVSVTSVTLKEE